MMKLFDYMYEIADKISKTNDYQILNELLKDDIKGLRDVRNFSAHDYEGIDLFLIEHTIKDDLPRFKKNIKESIKKLG
ncbi:HepT-like ribonuclease domain-containing protein [Campylobacter californiensis]|uniref:HepT-like ribonuclease domain-containing protein n=1 Tax=Campylobacter californiensis TaxID=1032243 RepID=UPI00214FC6E3|nr:MULTISPECIES: HepT-like ribonuclease domain-containing protein [unclassified Campylobacter]